MNLLDRTRSKIADLRPWLTISIFSLTLLLAFLLGRHPSLRNLAFLATLMGFLIILQQPYWGLFALNVTALIVPLEFGTGTQVSLNTTVLLVPALLGVWVLEMVRRQKVRPVPSPANRPLLLFVGAALLSLVAGNALWDPAVPRPANLLVVQLGQWAVFALSAAAFWLAANLFQEKQQLRTLTFFFLTLGGVLALARVLPGAWGLAGRFATIAVDRAPFWICLIALAGGQWLFNRRLARHVRWGLLLVSLAAVYYGLVINRASISTWAPSAVALGALLWLRFPRWRWLLLVGAVLSLFFFFAPLYEFAGGESEWAESGGSRILLVERVVKVTMHNPILGLGPASYRAYAGLEPLQYQQALWWQPNISSHNNYVDIFAQTGLVGLALFLWFLVELIRLNWHLSLIHREGFLSGYVNGALAMLIALLLAMLLADWFLPFVYNIGFPGFQASVLAWVFLGGLVAVKQFDSKPEDGPSSA